MEYTKYIGKDRLNGQYVSLLQYESNDNIPYCNCSRCGKPIKRKMIVVQDADTSVEMFYLGADCYKKLFK